MTRRAALGGLLVTLATAPGAAAQAAPSEVRLDAGYARVRQESVDPGEKGISVDAALIALYWRKPTDRWSFLTSGNLTYTRDSLAAAQGVAAFSFPWRRNEHLQTDVGAAWATFSLRSAGRGGNGTTFVRQHYVRDQWGSWLGGTLGWTERDRDPGRALAADIGLWGRWRALYGSASYSRANSNDFRLLTTSGASISPFAQSYEIEDLQGVVEARYGPHLLSTSVTSRRAIAGAALRTTVVAGRVAIQATDRVALLVGAGKQLFDPVRGLPEAEILTASLRISLGTQTLPVMQRSTLSEAIVQRLAGGGGRLEIRVLAADTASVEVAGDFSAWLPLELVREGSYWVARVDLPAGKYHVGVRLRYGIWRAPRNLARVRDEYGGESGVVVIP